MADHIAPTRFLYLVALGLVLSASTATWLVRSSDPSSSPRQTGAFYMNAAGHEMWSSATPGDWATNADHVVDLTMLDESPGYTDGQFQDRRGNFKVNKVLYSRTGGPALPESFEMNVAGWSVGTDGERRPLVFARGASRLEPGHRYVAALIHLEPRCNADDGHEPGGWSTIGGLGVLPFDDDVLGRGELEGGSHETEVTPGSILATVRGPGLTLSGLVALIKASPQESRAPQPGERVGC